MITPKSLLKLVLTSVAAGTLGAASSFGVIAYDQSVTPTIIFGTGGNANGSYAVDSSNNIELGLRAKVRHDLLTGGPQNTFNSGADGTYTFDKGVPFGQSNPTGVWSFEWAINSDISGLLSRMLNDLDYVLSIDSDASQGVNFTNFDPINDPVTAGSYLDHSIGTNSTPLDGGTEATSNAEYLNLISLNNVAQQSWKAAWYVTGYDPTVDGTYDFKLTAFQKGTRTELASTSIQVIQGKGGSPVPDAGSTAALLGAGILGLLGFRRFSRHS